METCSYPRLSSSSLPSLPPLTTPKCFVQYPISKWRVQYQTPSRFSNFTPLSATLNAPKGFGPSKKKIKNPKKPKKEDEETEDDDEDEEDDEAEEEGIPEIVTNRMVKRMGLTVGVPLFTGVLLFPFFYYLKKGLNIDLPSWIPYIVSFLFYGTALLGISYAIVSSSWDPLREGSLLGWNEAQKNWPVFWQSIRGGSKKK